MGRGAGSTKRFCRQYFLRKKGGGQAIYTCTDVLLRDKSWLSDRVYGSNLKSSITIKENKINIISSRSFSTANLCCTCIILRLFPVLSISRIPYTLLKRRFSLNRKWIENFEFKFWGKWSWSFKMGGGCKNSSYGSCLNYSTILAYILLRLKT